MGRGIYEHELNDPDFHWLIEEFLKRESNYVLINHGSAPLSLIPVDTSSQTVQQLEHHEEALDSEEEELINLWTLRREES